MAGDSQMRLGALGEVVEALDELRQSILIIVSTRPGSDPFRPEFACDLWQFIDWPETECVPAIIREVSSALARWEPRIELLAVRVTRVDSGWLRLELEWRPLFLSVDGSPSFMQLITVGGIGGDPFTEDAGLSLA